MPLELNGTSGVLDNSGAFIAGTAVASTSGTSIDFTSIPTWVKRVTIMLSGVSTNGSSIIQVQIGSGSVSTSSYTCNASYAGGAGALVTLTTGFALDVSGTASSSTIRSGALQINLVGSNTWIGSGNISSGSVGLVSLSCSGNSPALGGALDRVRITTVNGTDTFDAGSVNILYE